VAALDKEQLGARLGPEAIRMWERANGRSTRLLKLIRPPESFEESFEFEREIETASRCCSCSAGFWSSSPCVWAQFISLRKN
jgi:hypothetical protein